MRYIRAITILSVTALLALGWIACGAADAQLQAESGGASAAVGSTDEASFVEPVVEPSGKGAGKL